MAGGGSGREGQANCASPPRLLQEKTRNFRMLFCNHPTGEENYPDYAAPTWNVAEDSAPTVPRSNASDMLRHDPAGPRIRAGLDIDRPEVVVVDVLQRHRHHFGLAVDA